MRKTNQEVMEVQNYRKSAHCTYDIKYHIVWITKYRKPAITGQIAERTRELIRGTCKQNDVEILAGHVSKDHIHLLVSSPPHLSVSKLVQYMKGYSSRKLQMEYKDLNKQFWGRHLWGRGYFVASSGNVTDEVIAEYIRTQDIAENMKPDNFNIEGL
jgi:putative transposase